MTAPAAIDPIRLELIKNALDAIVDEMAIALDALRLFDQHQDRDGHVLGAVRCRRAGSSRRG